MNPQSSELHGAPPASIHGHQPRIFNGQTAQIVELLLRRRGQWVPATELARIALQYGSRLWSARRAGYTILNRTERIGGKVHGAYMLVGCPGEPSRPALALCDSQERRDA